jgi:tetraacyldisaccharide-1-P 4'-kinase
LCLQNDSHHQDFGKDEASELKHHLPKALIGIGSNRIASLFECMDRGKEKGKKIGVAIMDDGLQYHSIRKSLEVLMVNCVNPFGNGHAIPRGILRENPRQGFRRAQVIVLHNSNLVERKEIQELRKQIKKCEFSNIFADIVKTIPLR